MCVEEEKVQELMGRFGGYWEECKEFPLSDWIYEVRNNTTRQGYWHWVFYSMQREEIE